MCHLPDTVMEEGLGMFHFEIHCESSERFHDGNQVKPIIYKLSIWEALNWEWKIWGSHKVKEILYRGLPSRPMTQWGNQQCKYSVATNKCHNLEIIWRAQYNYLKVLVWFVESLFLNLHTSFSFVVMDITSTLPNCPCKERGDIEWLNSWCPVRIYNSIVDSDAALSLITYVIGPLMLRA